LFKIATQGVFLWHFHVYMYYSPNWFISIFLLSTLVPFLWLFQPVANGLLESDFVHSCIKSWGLWPKQWVNPWWVYNIMALLGNVEKQEATPWMAISCLGPFLYSLFSASWLTWVEQFCSTMLYPPWWIWMLPSRGMGSFCPLDKELRGRKYERV
jgi:hypothetical protein